MKVPNNVFFFNFAFDDVKLIISSFFEKLHKSLSENLETGILKTYLQDDWERKCLFYRYSFKIDEDTSVASEVSYQFYDYPKEFDDEAKSSVWEDAEGEYHDMGFKYGKLYNRYMWEVDIPIKHRFEDDSLLNPVFVRDGKKQMFYFYPLVLIKTSINSRKLRSAPAKFTKKEILSSTHDAYICQNPYHQPLGEISFENKSSTILLKNLDVLSNSLENYLIQIIDCLRMV